MSQSSTLKHAMLSPVSPPRHRRDSVTSEQTAKSTNTHMLRIKNLLNPMNNSNNQADGSTSLRTTPAYTANELTSTPTPVPDTPLTPASTKRQKNGKGKLVTKRAAPKGVVNYRSYECNENVVCADPNLRKEIIDQHRCFQVSIEGEGLISDYPKHIPYTSDKKNFHNKTGRDAFEFFEYSFIMPDDVEGKIWKVLWDYQIGLVRITPFFKALGYSKTTPAKAIKTNPGLEDLVHSITGGALAAQGYWVPFSCARALCATFCWEIRWVLTPLFGPGFVTECLLPDHQNYRRWKIDSNIVRRAELQAEGWRAQASRSGTPASQVDSPYAAPYIPMHQPPTSAPTSNPSQARHPGREKPVFMKDSPFSPGAGKSNRGGTVDLVTHDSDVSPKSSPAPTSHSGWMSINQRAAHPSALTNTPTNALNRSLLLTQPYQTLKAQESAWRGLNGERSASPASIASPKSTVARERPNREPSAENSDKHEDIVVMSDSSYKSSPVSSDSSVMSSPPPPPLKKVKLTKRRRQVPDDRIMASSYEDTAKAKEPEHMEVHDEVVEAAKLLMMLHEDDKMLHRKW